MKAEDYPDIAKLWNFEKNEQEGYYFDKTTPGSGKKVWWKCEKGHEWQAAVYNVIGNNSNCPYCSGRKAISGKNDLLTLIPELAKEWNYEKNNNLSPQQFTPGSGKKVWWKCEKGHEWNADIHSRSAGVGCPYCAGKKVLRGFNDLATTNPELLAEWNYKKNKEITPYMVSFGSEKRVWWICKNGHEWKAMVGGRVNGRGCPYCSNRRVLEGNNTIDITHPEIAKMWNADKNKGLTPSKVVAGSGKIVWWKCEKGHEWQAAPYNIVKGQGCPYCSNRAVLKGFNDLETINPDLASEWDYEKNDDLKPSDVIPGSTKKIWWKCKRGHTWCARVYSRSLSHASCPFCSLYRITSIPEKALAYYLLKEGIFIEENKKISGKKEVDIFIPDKRIAIEYDGQYWHKNKKRDIAKNRICKKADIKLLRIREPNLPSLNSTSYDYRINKLDHNYTYMDDVIGWVFEQIGISNKKISIEDDIQDIYDYYDRNEVENSIIKSFPQIAEEWDYEKNTVDIQTVPMGSNIKAWWKCNKCGYSWQQGVYNRCKGSGKCPKCASLRLVIGHNDLATARKDLLKEWDYNKNKTIAPTSVKPGSHRKVWWKCEKGHEYQASPNNRSRGGGCPICAGKKVLKGFNDLATKKPGYMKDWDYKKNGRLTPYNIASSSNRAVWWKCHICGHRWKQRVADKRYAGCRDCRFSKKDNDNM